MALIGISSGAVVFEAEGLVWRASGPVAEILEGPEEQPHRVVPSVSPAVSETELVRTELGRCEQHRWTWRQGPHALGWTLGRLLDRPGFTVQARFTNGGRDPVRLRRLVLLDGPPDALQVSGDPSAWWLDSAAESRRVGTLADELPSADDVTRRVWAGFNMPVPLQLGLDERKADGRWRLYRDWLTLFTDEGRRGLAIGPVGRPLADLDHACRVERGRVRVVVSSEMTDVRVEPGEVRESQEAAVLWGDYTDAMEALLKAVATSHGARTHRGPAVGWCSWYHSASGVTAGDVLGLAGSVDTDRLPLPYIQIDDGFERQAGDWRLNDRFAAGWGPLLQAIRQAGAEPAIWLAPLAVHETTDLFREHPDWFQRDARGDLVGEANNWGPRARWLDPTHPEARAWIGALMREYRSLGFTGFKIDFSNVGEGVRFHDATRTGFQVLRDLHRLYRDCIGEESYLLGCLGMRRAVCGLVDAARVGPDSCPVWRAAHPCTIEECIRSVSISSLANGILWVNDPDVAYARPRGGLTEDENRTWLGQVALLGGSVFTSEPFQTTDADLGAVRLRRQGRDLVVEADVLDDEPARQPLPFNGSGIAVFTTSAAGPLHQWFALPALPGLPAAGSLLVDGSGEGIRPTSRIAVTSARTPAGWRLTAALPGVADHAGFAVEAMVYTQRRLPGSATWATHVDGTLFGTGAPHVSTRGYRPLADGEEIEGAVRSRGWAGTEHVLARLVPPAPEKARPWRGGVDREGRQIGYLARRPWGQWGVIQIHNPADDPVDQRLFVEGLAGLGVKVHAWSFWDRRYLGIVDPAAIRFRLAAHAPVLLRLTPPDPERPVLVGSTLHMSQGAAELRDWRTTSEYVEVLLHGAGSQCGALWVASPRPLALAHETGLHAVPVAAGPLWRIDISDRLRRQEQVIRLHFTPEQGHGGGEAP